MADIPAPKYLFSFCDLSLKNIQSRCRVALDYQHISQEVKGVRKLVWVFLSLSLIFSIPTASQSSSWQKSNQKTIRHYKFKKSDPVYQLRWKEQTKTTTSGGETYVKKKNLNGSVCYNYPEGSIEYRGCRHQARKHFRDKCDFYKEKYQSTKRPYNEEYKLNRDMFCLAGSNFQP